MPDKKPYFMLVHHLGTLKTKHFKTSTTLNAFKHNIKEHYINDLKRRDS